MARYRLKSVRLYDAILAILMKRGEANYGEIVADLERLRSKGLIDYEPEDISFVLSLAYATKVITNGDGKFRLNVKINGDYKRILEAIMAEIG